MDEPFEYIVAQDLDRAWLNFEPDTPLKPMPNGERNPFYVTRPDDVTVLLKQAMLRTYGQPPKYILSGHLGCGKSTELYRLTADPAIQKKFWVTHFSIREQADINDLDYKDVLLTIGTQMFNQYQERGGKLPSELLEELDAFRGELMEEISTIKEGRKEGGLEAKLKAGFAELTSRVKLEPETRRIIRQKIDFDITRLIKVINNIAIAIQAKEKKAPAVFIDDLDKPDLETARRIFYDRQELMLRPNCVIVYTVSSSLFYDAAIAASRAELHFLPNIKLHEQNKPQVRDPKGYYTLQMCVHQRMAPELITPEALELVIAMSGGVFRELARLMRLSIGRAQLAERAVIERRDVERAAAEIRSTYWRVLTADQRVTLRQVRQHNQMRDPDKLGPLLQILAVLQYDNGRPWYDIHPVLHELLDSIGEEEPPANS